MTNITKEALLELESKLEEEKKSIEKELKNFAKKEELKGDWKTRFPYFDGEIGGAQLEKAAEEVEEYEAKLPVEYALEVKLRDVILALNKIKRNQYGLCEKCKKPIDVERLKVCPEARFCMECQRR